MLFWHLFCSQLLLFQLLNVSWFFSEQSLVSAHIYTSYAATVQMGVKPYAALRIGRYHQWVKNTSFFLECAIPGTWKDTTMTPNAKLLRPHDLPPLQHCTSWNNPCKIHHSSLLMNSRSSNWLKQNETNVLHLLSGTLVPELKGNVPFYLCQGRLTKFHMRGIVSYTSQWAFTKAFGVPQVKTIKVIWIPKTLSWVFPCNPRKENINNLSIIWEGIKRSQMFEHCQLSLSLFLSVLRISWIKP